MNSLSSVVTSAAALPVIGNNSATPSRGVRPRYNSKLLVLFVSYLFPVTFAAGGLALTPTRLILICFFVRYVPGLITGRLSGVDKLVLLHSLWVTISLATNHGISGALEAGGIYSIEMLGGYALVRRTVTQPAAVVGGILACVAVALVTLPAAFFEASTGVRIYGVIFGGDPYSGAVRLGLHRVKGPFQHSILYGCFCGSMGAAAMAALKIVNKGILRSSKYLILLGVSVGTFLSLSSGGLLTFNLQIMLLAWDVFIKRPKKWHLLLLLSLVSYGVIDVLSSRSGYMAILSKITFNTGNVYYRKYIFQYGMDNVWANPIFGIGFNDWIRPNWMVNVSVDNFWLLTAMRYGIPSFLLLVIPFLMVIAQRGRSEDSQIQSLLLGLRISVFALVMAGTTVHLWSNLLTHLLLLLGLTETVRLMKSPHELETAVHPSNSAQ